MQVSVKLNLFTLVALAFLSSCSEKTNINQFFVSKNQENALDILISRSEYAYDNGEFADALSLAEKAYKISPGNETVAVLLGYINLALGGIDSFKLAKGLIQVGKASSSTEKTLVADNKGASEIFSKLTPVIGLDDDDLFKLGDLDEASTEYPLFEGENLILPFAASKARESGVKMLTAVNKAIDYICPFIDREAKIEDDERHQCDETKNPRQVRSKSHFIWAFAHLAEAIAFYSAVLYQEQGKDKTNLENRIDSLRENKDSLSVTSYVDHVVDLAGSVKVIMPVDDPDSQLQAMLNDLKSVSFAFAVLVGLPKKMTKGINRALTSIEEKQDQVSGTSNKEAAGLKAELTKKMAQDLSAQIDEAANGNNPPSEEQLEDLCDAFAEISQGTGTPPDACQ